MLKIHKQAKAEDDLIDIWLYTFEKWDVNQADHYLDNLNDALNNIAANPDIGTACEYIKKGYQNYTPGSTTSFTAIPKKLYILFASWGMRWTMNPFCRTRIQNPGT